MPTPTDSYGNGPYGVMEYGGQVDVDLVVFERTAQVQVRNLVMGVRR